MTVSHVWRIVKLLQLDVICMRREPEQERAIKSLELIRESARELIGHCGTDGFSMTMLAAKAGLSKPALYRYFPNKREILIDLAKFVFDENKAMLSQYLSNVRPGYELDALIQTLTDYCKAQNTEPYRRHLRAAMSADPTLVELDLADSEENAKFAALIFRDLLPDIQTDELHRRLLVLMNQMEPFAKLVSSRPKDEQADLIKTFATFCLAGLNA